MKLSLVVPVFNEESTLPAFMREVDATLGGQPFELEVVFVDDGSTDGTLAWLRARTAVDPRVRYTSLSRNYGSHPAVAAGLARASGDAAVVLAVDLQDPLPTVLEFVARWREGAEVVWGARGYRDDPWLYRAWARAYYAILRRIAFPNYPREGTGSFCLLDRKVIDAVNRFTEHNRLTFGIVNLVGFRHEHVPYHRGLRVAGHSKWSLARRFQAALDSFVAYSFVPLRLISYLGLAMAVLSFAAIVYVVLSWWARGTQLVGWPSIVALILLIGGIHGLMLGVLGEYIWRIAEDVRARPLYIVREHDGERR